MDKTHIAGSGISAGFLALGINTFFPHANISSDQMAFIVGVLPSVAMAVIVALEAISPKAKIVIEEVKAAEGVTTPAPAPAPAPAKAS